MTLEKLISLAGYSFTMRGLRSLAQSHDIANIWELNVLRMEKEGLLFHDKNGYGVWVYKVVMTFSDAVVALNKSSEGSFVPWWLLSMAPHKDRDQWRSEIASAMSSGLIVQCAGSSTFYTLSND